MSRVTRRKHVMKELMDDDYSLPKANQQIVSIQHSRGSNLLEVESSSEELNKRFLVSMPSKYRNNIWVKRGDFVLVEPIKEGDKVKAEIVRILTPEHVKEYTKFNVWPKKFTKKREVEIEENADDDDDLIKNLNRPHLYESETESEVESSDDESEENL